jgi:FlaA1/EpsC-like NDP-sugar epimerase
VAASRLVLGLLPDLRGRLPREERTRILIVGAGRSGRSLARELAETPGRRVVGFLDDNTGLHRRRIHGLTVHGTLEDVERLLEATRADEVLVTIPDAASARLAGVVEACAAAGVDCRFVRREIAAPSAAAGVSAE